MNSTFAIDGGDFELPGGEEGELSLIGNWAVPDDAAPIIAICHMRFELRNSDGHRLAIGPATFLCRSGEGSPQIGPAPQLAENLRSLPGPKSAAMERLISKLEKQLSVP